MQRDLKPASDLTLARFSAVSFSWPMTASPTACQPRPASTGLMFARYPSTPSATNSGNEASLILMSAGGSPAQAAPICEGQKPNC